MTHSGLQLGGDPIISRIQVHWQRPPTSRGGKLFGPQGLGSQGSSATTGSIARYAVLVSSDKSSIECLTFWSQATRWERIPFISLDTSACSDMVDNPALGIDTTKSRTWVNTVQSWACFVGGTIGIDSTFWSACYIWVAEVILNTFTSCSTISVSAKSIRTTWRWVARIWSLCDSWRSWK